LKNIARSRQQVWLYYGTKFQHFCDIVEPIELLSNE